MTGFRCGFKSASAKRNPLKRVARMAINRLQPVLSISGGIDPAGERAVTAPAAEW
jgi:hypothetical protein